MKEVLPGIFRITEKGLLGNLKPPVNIYVIPGKNGIVYDAGYGTEGCLKKFSDDYSEILKVCAERGMDVKIDRVILSHAHADHFSGLKGLRKRWGLKIVVTEKMKRIIYSGRKFLKSVTPGPDIGRNFLKEYIVRYFFRFLRGVGHLLYSLYWGVTYVKDPDIIIGDEDIVEINGEKWEIFRSPGHSTEHITLYSMEKGILFSGDNILKDMNVWLGPPSSDLDEYIGSLERIRGLAGLKVILPAHGGPIFNPYERITEIIEWREKRTDDVSSIVRDAGNNGVTLSEIIRILYPDENFMKRDFARGWVRLTLEKMVKERLILARNGRYIFALNN